MSDKQGADDSANITGREYDDWHYEQMSMREIEPPPSQRVDPMLYRYVVWALAAIGGVGMLGILILAALGIEPPAAVGTIATSCIVGLVALLSTPSKA